MARHAALVSAFIESGRLLQGVADAHFANEGADRPIRATDALRDFVHALARATIISWDSRGSTVPVLPAVPEICGEQVELKVPEGYAFYAVYPEAFAEAARELVLSAPARVIGIRSIGASLGAIVAAALDSPPAITIRPIGDPFDRSIAIAPDLEADLLAGPAHFVIVDEGPGLSGSSFGAVADWLECRGVPLDRIAFLCSHSGAPGPQALHRHRDRWSKAQRVVADFGPKLPSIVKVWAEDLLGPIEPEVLEISGGGWRGMQAVPQTDWPAVNPMWERRKFLFWADGRQWLARFAGLGREGERKLEIARRLHANGLVPEPLGLANGFLVEAWRGDARPLGPGAKPIAELSRYIAARAGLPVPRPGATLAELHVMARRNVGLVLGSDREVLMDHWLPRLPRLQDRVRPACTDNRMDRHEWLRVPNGRLLKADAVDHHAGHDLIGCQDLAWDVAGAVVEFDLDEPQARQLIAATEDAAGRLLDLELLDFLRVAYLAFRLGQANMSAGMTTTRDSGRWTAREGRYSSLLDARLQLSGTERLATFP